MKIKVTKGPWDKGGWVEIAEPFTREDFEWSAADVSTYVGLRDIPLASIANERGSVHLTVPGVVGKLRTPARLEFCDWESIAAPGCSIGYDLDLARCFPGPQSDLSSPFDKLRRCKSIASMNKVLADYAIRVELETLKHYEEWVASALADANASLVRFCDAANESQTRTLVQTLTGQGVREQALKKLPEDAPARLSAARVDELRAKIAKLREELVGTSKEANWHAAVAVCDHLNKEEWTVNACKLPDFVVEIAKDALNKSARSEDRDNVPFYY